MSETTDACVAPAPTGLTVTSDTDDSVSLSWNTVTDAGAYKVEYRRSGSISWLHAGYVWSGSSDTVDGLDCNTSYYFQVRARGDGSPYSYTYGNPSSSVSETTDACVAPAPTGLTVTSDTDDSVSLSWNAVTDAGAYKVEYRRSSSISWLHAGYVWSGSSDTVDGLDCNTSYYFQVRARGDGSPYSYTYGNPSFSVSETTDACPVPVAPAPTGLTVTSDTDDSVSLSWNAVTDAAVYQVEYRRSSSISWLHAGYVWSGSSDTVDGLDCNTSYDFRVRARGDGSPYSTTYGNPSSSVSETTGACVAPAPTGLTVTSDTDDTVSLSWNAVTDAAVYQVEYRRSSSISWLHAGYVYSSTSDTVDGLDCNTGYDFRVRARGDGSPYSTTYGNPSSSVSETTDACPVPVAPAPTGLTVTSDTDDSVSLSWNTVTDAAVYQVEYRRSSSISWLHAGYVWSGSSDTVDGLDCNTSYYFQVRARGDGSPYSYTYGNPSSSVSETTDACVAPAPTGLTVTSDTDDSVSLSWNPVTDAGAYKVEYRRSSSISWLHAGYVYSSTSDTVDGLDCDTSYDFRVRARGDGSPYPTTYGNPSSSVSETTSTCSNNPPAFNPASYSFSVNEDGANGTPVGTVLATDPDAGDAVSYSITPVNAKFAIGKTSGVITVADALDHETQSSHILTVEASDGNGGTDTATVGIAVGDVNEVSISSPGNVVEGADMTFTVTAEQGGVTVTYDIGGTAARGDDYVDPGLGPLTVTIPAGETTRTIVVDTESDTTAETFELVVITLTGVAVGNAVVDSANSTATARIADLINVSSIDDDDEAPPIVVDTSEPTSTIWFKLAGDGGLLDFNHYNNRAYVIKVEAEAQPNGSGNWSPGKIVSAKTGQQYQDDLPRFGDLGDGQASWVEGNNAPDHRYILLEVERPSNVPNLSKYRITLSKPDYTLIEPEWGLPAPGDTTGTLNVRIGVRNSSDDASTDRKDDKVVLTCTALGGGTSSRSYSFKLLRDGRNNFVDGESEQMLDLGTVCGGMVLTSGVNSIESLKVELNLDNSLEQTAAFIPEPPVGWPFPAVDTLRHKQSDVVNGAGVVVGGMMGGLQMYMNDVPMPGYFRWCTSSFSLDLKANSAAKRATHGSPSFQAMSTTAHCQAAGGTWYQGGIDNAGQRDAELLGQNLWLPPRAVVATTKCTIVVGDGSFDAQEKCLRGDQAYTKVGAVPALATWVYEDTNIYMPSAQSPNTISALAKPLIEYFKNNAASNRFAIVGARPPKLMEEVHKVGRTTGWTSGTIKEFIDNPDDTCPGSPLGLGDHGTKDGYYLECLVQTDMIVEGGDSGAPVFAWASRGSPGMGVVLVGVVYGKLGGNQAVFIPIDRIYAASLREGYGWATEVVRPLPTLKSPPIVSSSTLRARFVEDDFSPGPDIYYAASLFRSQGGGIPVQVTDAAGNVLGQEVGRNRLVVEFNVSQIPLDQRSGDFSVRVVMCPRDAGSDHTLDYCGSYGPEGATTVLPLLVPPPPQGLVATGDTGGRARLEWTLVPNASTYKFQYRESSTDNGNGWTDVTGTAPTSPTYVRNLGCRTYDFRVSAQGDGTSYNTGWSDWSEATSTTVTTCTTGSRSTRDTGQSIGVPTVVEESQ